VVESLLSRPVARAPGFFFLAGQTVGPVLRCPALSSCLAVLLPSEARRDRETAGSGDAEQTNAVVCWAWAGGCVKSPLGMLLPFGLPSLVSRPVRISSLVPRPVLIAVFLKKINNSFYCRRSIPLSRYRDIHLERAPGRPAAGLSPYAAPVQEHHRVSSRPHVIEARLILSWSYNKSASIISQRRNR
jgi:hypothetical protein